MRRFVSWGPALVVIVTAALAAWLTPNLARHVGYAQAEARVVLARQELHDDDILERMSLATRAVAESVLPSVAHIEVRSGRGRSGAAGAGWLFDDEGHVITNAHVISGARSIRVELSDGRVFQAERVGVDPFTDIAVIKLPTTDGLVPADRATGDHPQVGDIVFAFGSPFGFKFTMNQGIISALGRDPQGAVQIGNGFTNFIQTDAAVNPGHSGGPLVNANGRVIGMNVAIATGADNDGSIEGQSAGISFAIPLTTIEGVVTQLIETGTVRRGFLGVSSIRTNDPLFTPTGYEPFNGSGVLVPSVTRGGPADLAGLRPGDIITHVDGERVTSVGVLRSLISNSPPGQTVHVTVQRDGASRNMQVTLAEFPEEQMASSPVFDQELQRRGLVIRETRDESELRVFAVEPNTPASRAGLQPDQVILAVNGTRIEGVRQYLSVLVETDILVGEPLRLTVRDVGDESGESERTVTLRAR